MKNMKTYPPQSSDHGFGAFSRYHDGEVDSTALNATLDAQYFGGGVDRLCQQHDPQARGRLVRLLKPGASPAASARRCLCPGLGSVGLVSLDLAANAKDANAKARLKIPLGKTQ